MTGTILALNAGSSSIKFSLYTNDGTANGQLTALADGEIEAIGTSPRLTIHEAAKTGVTTRKLPAGLNHEKLLSFVLEWIRDHPAGFSLQAVGHRIVHGGADFSAPVLIDGDVLERLDRLVPLAPLHQPHNLAAVRAMAAAVPGLPQIACFDTGFHSTNLPVATDFGLPRALTGEGIRRYGFHGLSYEYIARVLPAVTPAADGRVVVAHLGHGASMCAMRQRHSVATTMGFTALDGLVMGQRCGTLDPGVILYLIREKGMDYEALADLLYHHSGLLGISGISDDMRDLLTSQAPEAGEAVELFVYRITRELGSLAAALGGLDALVFTGGIGEHAAIIRERVCRQAEWLGIKPDYAANNQGAQRISLPESPVAVFVIPTDEDQMIARHTLTILKNHGGVK